MVKAKQPRIILIGLVLGLLLSVSVAGPQGATVHPVLPGQTATRLPDGRWLLLGGEGPSGPVATATIIEPRTGASTDVAVLAVARAWHTVTVVTDGRVLIAGGMDAAGHPIGDAQVWSVVTGMLDRVVMSASRTGHQARLQADGSVVLFGGHTGDGSVLGAADRFDVQMGAFSAMPALADPGFGAPDVPRLAGSVPANGAADAAHDTVIALRFSVPLRPGTLTAGTVTLSGPQGPESARVIATEGGMLVFVTPAARLTAGTAYSVSVNGAEADDGSLLPWTEIRFTTAAEGGDPNGGGDAASGASATDTAHQHHPAGPTPVPGAPAEVDPEEWTGARRNGQPHSPWQTLAPLRARPGVTALSGQVLRLNGEPLADVTLELGNRSARTDRTGRFLLTGIPAGSHEFEMDGSTANRPGRTYGTFSYRLDITPNVTNVLPFTIWMPLLDMQHATALSVPTTAEVVATTPRIPGLEVHVPSNVVLRTYAGPLRTISLTRIPVDRTPFPLPPGTTFFFTPQGHGAKVQRPDGTPSTQGIRVVLPNPDRLAPGTRVELWNYDYGKWAMYGQATVSEDGTQIVPDPGVELHRFTCTFILGPISNFIHRVLDGLTSGDPIDLGTGLFTLDKVDLVLPDVIPIVMQRQYRPGQAGYTYFTYQMYLTGDTTAYSVAELVLADGVRVRYDRTSPGTDKAGAVMEHTATPTRFYKSRLTWNASRAGWDITFRDGTVYEFPGEGKLPGPMLVGIRDRAGNRLTISRYLSFANVMTRITSPNGRWVDVTQDTNYAHKVTQLRDNLGRTVSYTYDAFIRLTSVTDAAGGVTEYTYPPTGGAALLTIRDPRNIVYATNEYNAQGRVIKQTQADGTFWTFAYTVDGAGKVTQTDVTDPRGHVRRVTFNSAGYVLTDTAAHGTALAQTTTYERQANTHLITAVTDALGRRTEFTYDAMGNVLTVTRLAGTGNAVATTYAYTATFNQVASVTDPLNHTTSLGYDGAGNLTSITNALNQTTTLTYNSAGQPLTVTTPLNHTTTFGYDQGDLATVTDPLGKTTTRFTDGGGRLLSVTAPLGQRTNYTYDALNQLTRITDALAGQTQFAYDANGNLLTVTDARSNATTYAYSNMDRVSTRTDPLTHQESYTYDNNGNPASHTDRKSQITGRSYDALDRLSVVTFADSSTITYTYDAGNRITQIVDSLNGTLARSYDGLDRPTQEVTPQGTVSYTYDAAGRRATMTVTGQPTVSYTYDNANRLTHIQQGTNIVTMAYDAGGRQTSLTLPNGVTTASTYDDASRLTGLTYTYGTMTLGTLTHAYDARGHRTQVGGTWARTGIPAAINGATYNAANQQVSFNGQTQTFDLNGNLTSDGITTYTWNARDQLAGLIQSGLAASFAYDATGRRRSSTLDTETTTFLYDGVNSIEETSAAGTATLLAGLSIDQLFSRSSSTGFTAVLMDTLGSVPALTDATGAVTTTYRYEPFGATTVSGPTSANRSQYTSRENDGTGLYYYRARYYHPGLQRFISEDPIGFAGGDPNLYAYVFNGPTGLRDPLGLAVDPISLAGFAIFCGSGAAINVITQIVLSGRKPSLGEAASAATIGCGVGVLTLTTGIAIGAAAAGGAVANLTATTASPAIVEGLVITGKIRRQMEPRGWTEQLVKEAVEKGQRVAATSFATGASATRYIHPETGQSVIVEDASRLVIHVGGKGFRY